MIKILSHVVLIMVILVLLPGCSQTTTAHPGYPIINSVNPQFSEKYIDVSIDFPGDGIFDKIYYINAWYIIQGDKNNYQIEIADNHDHYSSRFIIKSFNNNNNLPPNARVFINIDATSEWTVSAPPINQNNYYRQSHSTYESWLWENGKTIRLNHTESDK